VDSPDSCRISVPGSTQVPGRRQTAFAYGALTLFGRLSHTFPLAVCFLELQRPGPTTPRPCRLGLGCSHFARHYFGNAFFSSGYLDVSVPQVPSLPLCVHVSVLEVRSSGFPHSDIPGSVPVHGSPRLFAVTHVLHRHLVPRHPP
jgi:hypothetical protein